MKAKKEKWHKSIEDIITTTPTDRVKRDVIIEGAVFSLPFVVSFLWYVNVILSTTLTSTSKDLSLSPITAEPLVIFLFAFIIIYGLFLVYMFNVLHNKLKEHKRKKSSKKVD